MTKERYGCAMCGKGIQHYNLVSFSKNRVHRVRKPNLHSHKMVLGGESVKVKLCSRCKRMVRMAEDAKKMPAVEVK